MAVFIFCVGLCYKLSKYGLPITLIKYQTSEMAPQEIKTTVLIEQRDYTLSLVNDPNRNLSQTLCLNIYET